jgi:hypothetical protein
MISFFPLHPALLFVSSYIDDPDSYRLPLADKPLTGQGAACPEEGIHGCWTGFLDPLPSSRPVLARLTVAITPGLHIPVF